MKMVGIVRDQLEFFATDYKLQKPLGRLPRLTRLGLSEFTDVAPAVEAMPTGHKLKQLTILTEGKIGDAESHIRDHFTQLRVPRKDLNWALGRCQVRELRAGLLELFFEQAGYEPKIPFVQTEYLLFFNFID